MPDRIEVRRGLQFDQQVDQRCRQQSRLGVDDQADQSLSQGLARQLGRFLKNAAQRRLLWQLRQGTDDAVAATADHAQTPQVIMSRQQFQRRPLR